MMLLDHNIKQIKTILNNGTHVFMEMDCEMISLTGQVIKNPSTRVTAVRTRKGKLQVWVCYGWEDVDGRTLYIE